MKLIKFCIIHYSNLPNLFTSLRPTYIP